MMKQIAAVQMTSGADVATNLEQADRLIGDAARAGAELVVLPENFAVFSADEMAKVALGETFGSGPVQDFLAARARQHGVVLVGGTLPLRCADASRIRAASLVFGPDGALLARYDKMHLFDVDASGAGESYRESRSIEPGEEMVVVKTPVGRVGLAVCYDVRFPELFRALVDRGAEIITLPSAFTATTGALHWELLVRARAVENLCTLVAPDQGGCQGAKRAVWGHSMVVGPWGEIESICPRYGEGIATGCYDSAAQRRLRERFPALMHRRLPVAGTEPEGASGL